MRLLLVESHPGSLEPVLELAGDPAPRVRRAAPAELAAALRRDEPELLLLEASEDDDDALAMIERSAPLGCDRLVLVSLRPAAPSLLRLCLQLGALDLLEPPLESARVRGALAAAWTRVERCEEREACGHLREREAGGPVGFEGLVGSSAVFQRFVHQARLAASRDAPLLVLGEAGTGKDLALEAIHAESRPGRPLLRLRAEALEERAAPAALRGVLREARVGPLVFGYLELLWPPAPGRLLGGVRREAARLGVAGAPRVAATLRRSLLDDLRRGMFRADLYHRLGLRLLWLPPLRERREDIEQIALHVLGQRRRACGAPPAVIDDEALAILERYPYPCNVSELRTIIELAAQAEPGSALTVSSLPSHVRQSPRQGDAEVTAGWKTMDELQLEHIKAVLEHTQGNRSEAARILGLSRTGLIGKIRRWGIDIPPQTGVQTR